MQSGIFQVTLKCALTADEVAARARGMAVCQQQIEENELEAKGVADSLKQQRKRLEAQRGIYALEVREESTFRQVDCVERLSEDGESVETVRGDTGKVVDTRPAHDSDRERELPLEEDTVAASGPDWQEEGTGSADDIIDAEYPDVAAPSNEVPDPEEEPPPAGPFD
jgi:hypothetical protein